MENENKIKIFTMQEYESFEIDFNHYITVLPDLMVENNIFPTVYNIKQHLIDYINCQENMPDDLKIDLGEYIKTETTFCNLISDVDNNININDMIKNIEPLDFDELKLKDDEIVRKQKQEELPLDGIHH